ncbi:SDR family NAD(P)-dependent oxidoreductase [Candidatus Binatus sp.]|uniref:SDR family NAD(P)-dependent oxidoreductase n=1 Tax=Candidatus Binatus sp. TaxID=2811406 RepID=UPI003BAFB32D
MPLPRPAISPRWRGLFEGRNVIVTGASSGIGREVATMFAQEGAKVGLFARRRALLYRIAEDIARDGGIGIPFGCDVTDSRQVRRSVERVEELFGGIDVVVNSAGVMIPGRLGTSRIEDFRQMMDVNFFGAVNLSKAALPIMLNAKRGNIVNIASIAGRRGGATLSGYSASKFALIGFTEALRMELFGTGVTASLVVPGPVDTPMLDNPEWQLSSWAFGKLRMPAAWVSWGVAVAVIAGLAEVEIPPGIVTAQKIATLFPDLTAAWLGLGNLTLDMMNRWMGSGFH